MRRPMIEHSLLTRLDWEGATPCHPEEKGGGGHMPAAKKGAYYRRSERTPWPLWLAWASIEVPACWRMFSFVNFVISDAMSTSRMRDSDAVRFSWYVARLFRRCSSRFWIAP